MKKLLIIAILSFSVLAQDKPKDAPKSETKQLTTEEQVKLGDLQKRAEQIQILTELLKKDARILELEIQAAHDCKGCTIAQDGKSLMPPDKPKEK